MYSQENNSKNVSLGEKYNFMKMSFLFVKVDWHQKVSGDEHLWIHKTGKKSFFKNEEVTQWRYE